LAARLLSGYLCGTHSGLLALGAWGRPLRGARSEAVAAAHRDANSQDAGTETELGRHRWQPEEHIQLADELRRSLDHPAVIDLVFYGSQARGSRTGFSDVDAILIIDDGAGDDPAALRRLRPRVLAAQRAVLAYQPMQHHGFEVVTPRLLKNAEAALALPDVAVAESCSLNGTAITAGFGDPNVNCSALYSVACDLRRLRGWPSHPWDAHRHVAMFELLPTLYLQARGMSVPKWQSFGEARAEFGDGWWAYDVLAEVRRVWPRIRHPMLEAAAGVLRNPWTAVAAWRRLPASLPVPVRTLLTLKLLPALQFLADSMVKGAR
jgi:hypothetical protein